MPDVRYLTFDVLTNSLIGEIVPYGVSFQNSLNAAGQFQGTVQLTDPGSSFAIASTLPGRTLLFITVDGTLRWSGFIIDSTYTRSTGQLVIRGAELIWYLSHLQQTRDYSKITPGRNGFATLNSISGSTSGTYTIVSENAWLSNPVPPAAAAAQMVADALYDTATIFTQTNMTPTYNQLGIFHSPVRAWFANGYPHGQWWTQESWPISSRQSLDQVISNLASEHITCGFDYAWNASLSGSTPSFTVDFVWPRRGFDCTGYTETGTSGGIGSYTTGIATVFNEDIIDLTYPVSADSQATKVFAVSGGTKGYRKGVGDFVGGASWDGIYYYFSEALPPGTSVTVAAEGGSGYVGTIEHVKSYGAIYGYRWKINWAAGSPTISAGTQLSAFATNGPTLAGYPPHVKTSSYTHVKSAVALENQGFSELSTLAWPAVTPTLTVDAFGPAGIGNVNAGDDIRVLIPAGDDRFPNGSTWYMRVVDAKYTIQDSGTSTAVYTLDMPPNTGLAAGGYPGFQPPLT